MEDCEICNKYKEHCYRKHEVLRGKQFYEVMKGDFSHQMKMPKKFSDHFKRELSQNVNLQSPSGKIWPVLWGKTANEMSFQAGWKEFVEHHHIVEGDVVVFKYNGNSCFQFSIFKGDHCERASSSVLKNNFEAQQKSDNSVEYLSAKSHNEVMMSISSDDTRSSSSFSGQNNEAPRTDQRAVVSCNKRVSRNNFAHQKKRLDRSCKMKDIQQESDGFISLEMFSLRNIYLPHKRLSVEEESKALMLLNSVRSRKPCFVSVIHPYSVHSGRFFTIPSSFVAKYLPRQDVLVSLSIPGHGIWPVKYTAGTMSGFCGKWHNFAHDNHLAAGDICLFELVKKLGNFMMKVHIARGASSSIS